MAGYAAAGFVYTWLYQVLMANQEWDDHDRSKKTMARDLCLLIMESCAPKCHSYFLWW